MFSIGAVWLDNQRISEHNQLVEAGKTLRVYVSTQRYEKTILSQDWIVKETDDWLILDKPAGISSVPDRSHLFDNMTAAVTHYFRKSNNRYHANPLTRLDFMTAGLMLYAKHKRAEQYLSKAMIARKIHKQYTTLVCHTQQLKPYPNCKRIQDFLTFREKAKVEKHGKACHSLFLKHSEHGHLARYNVILFTGRRHQIRCHASHYIAPVLGDTFYGGKPHKAGMALWASAYNFRDLSGRHVRIRLPLLETYVARFLNG